MTLNTPATAKQRAVFDLIAQMIERNEQVTIEHLKALTFPGKNLLTRREYEVLLHVVGGRPNKDIARTLGITYRTVEIHRRNVFSKLGVRNSLSLVWLVLTGKRAPFDTSTRKPPHESPWIGLPD